MSDLSPLFLELVSAYGKSQALRVAAELGVADHLGASPRTAAELAQLTASDAAALERLLWALESIGIVTRSDGDTFALSALGKQCLASDSASSLKAVAEYFSHPVCWNTWLALAHSIKTGKPAFPEVFETTAWEYRASHPEVARVFNAAMRAFAGRQQATIQSRYDFSTVETVVDVGGGNGTLLAGLLAAHPRMRGILLDLPPVVAGAPAVLEAAGVADRCEIVAGSFFDSVPSGGDVYVLRAIIHNWDTDAAARILSSCRRAMAPGSRILLIEILRRAAAHADRFWHHFLDLHMLVTLGGGERSRDQIAALYEAAGFRLTRVLEMTGDEDLIEGEPI